jgi:hypothetical protein
MNQEWITLNGYTGTNKTNIEIREMTEGRKKINANTENKKQRWIKRKERREKTKTKQE